MTDELPEITLGYSDSGAPAVYVDLTAALSAPDLVSRAPWLCVPERALLCAQAVNHLAQEQTYKVIDDPAGFADWYRARHDAEADGEALLPGSYSLRAFGMPDLARIALPAIEGGQLVFYAVNRQIGAPYRVTVALTELQSPDYDPLPMVAGG